MPEKKENQDDRLEKIALVLLAIRVLLELLRN